MTEILTATPTRTRSPFPRCCSAMSRWRSGRGWCGLPTSGRSRRLLAAGAGASVPVGWSRARAGQPAHWPRRALVVDNRDRGDLLRARSRRLERRHPHDQARQRDPVRQHRQLRLRRSTACGWRSGAPSLRQAVALLLAAVGAALLMSGSYELSQRNFAGDLLTLVAGLLYGGYLDLRRARRGPSSSRCRC